MDSELEKSTIAPVEEPKMDAEKSSTVDEQQTVLERFINLPSVMNFQLILQCAWETVAVTFQFSLVNGGPVSMVYGGILAGIGGTAVALSLAEMASIDPVIGAQYRWSASFAPFAPRFWGLIQGWLTIAAWIFNSASAPAAIANTVIGLAIFNNESYEPKRWHTAMVMWGFIALPYIINFFFRRVLNTLEMAGGILHVVFFIANLVILPVLARRSTNDYVFGTLTHDVSGWTNPGVAWGLGLLTVTAPVLAGDGILHMSSEVKRSHTRVPFSIIFSTVFSAVSQFAFMITVLYCIGDVDKALTTPTGLPIIEVYYEATGSKAATNVLVVALIFIFFVTLFNTYASVSRLLWAFARDNGLPFSPFFSKVNLRFKMPLNALGLIAIIVFLLSLIYIASSTAFNAFISLVSIGLSVSYIIPIFFIALRKVRGPPIAFGKFALGRWGIPINLFAVTFLIYIVIWMPFPQFLPVTGTNMNYAGPIFAAVILGAVLDWVISGRKRFEVPVARHDPDF